MFEIFASFRVALGLIGGADPELAGIVLLSLELALAGAVIGLPLGALVAVGRFPGRPALIVVLNALLGLPSVVVGLVVYLLLSRAGPLGSWGILFTPSAMVIAQTILVLPVIAALTRQLVGDSLRDGGDQLRSMGAGPLACALLM